MTSLFCYKFEIETFSVKIDFLNIVDKYERNFYFTLENVRYFKIVFFTFVMFSFLVAVLFEVLLKQYFVLEKNIKNKSSYLLNYFERFIFWFWFNLIIL